MKAWKPILGIALLLALLAVGEVVTTYLRLQEGRTIRLEAVKPVEAKDELHP